MHSDSRQRSTMFKALAGALSLFVSGVASQTLDFRNLKSCEQSHIQWRDAEGINPSSLANYTFSLSIAMSIAITYTLTITNVGPEGFNFTPNWLPVTPATILQTPLPPVDSFSNGGSVAIKVGFGNNNCIIDVDSAPPAQTGIVQPLPLPPTFVTQGGSQTQCATSNVVWTGGKPPYDIQILNAGSTDGIVASIELGNLQSTEMSLKVPFAVGTYAWVITDSIGATSNTTFPIGSSADDSCLIMPSTSNPSESSTSTTISEPTTSSTTEPTPIATATPQSAEAPKGPSKKSIIIAAVLGPVLGLLAVFGICVFVYYRIRRRNREKELKMKQEVTYVPPQHARLIDVKVKPPDIE